MNAILEMNAIRKMHAIRKAGIAVLLAVAMAPAATFAQNSSDATGTPSATSDASQPHTSKSIRQANRRLASRVRTALTKGKIDARSLTVLAKGGAVTLIGGGQDTAQIQRAGEIAKQVPGVTSVDNRLVQHSDQQ